MGCEASIPVDGRQPQNKGFKGETMDDNAVGCGFALPFKIVSLGSSAPPGWRMATCAEFNRSRKSIVPMMSEWAIAALADGQAKGEGYGGISVPGAGHDGVGEVS